jgi:hypothetical protein
VDIVFALTQSDKPSPPFGMTPTEEDKRMKWGSCKL